MPNYKKPTNHYDDIPSDEGEDYENPGVDMSDPRQGFDDNTMREVVGVSGNLSKAYQKEKNSRAKAAERMMED